MGKGGIGLPDNPARQDSCKTMQTLNKDALTLCIAGNLNIDLMISGVPCLPGWGEEQFGTNRRSVAAGQAGYMGMASSNLGMSVSIIGAVGDDLDGQTICDKLRDSNIDCSGISTIPDVATGLTIAIIREDGERCFVSEAGASAHFSLQHIESSWPLVEGSRFFAVVGLFNTPGLTFNDAKACLLKARQHGIVTVFDPGWDSTGWSQSTCKELIDLLTHVDLFLPNEDEAQAITGLTDIEKSLDFFSAAGVGTTIIKRGSKGAIARRGGQTFTSDARHVPNANAVGAGDVYDAALVSALARGIDFSSAMQFAARSAEYYVGRHDDRFPSLTDITPT
ncbi:MAG: carbohydrate kinase family protein [Rhizobiaceae bacterium]|nr:carbohydrate kinase family protein [Rhizobiaceae bacterium]